jgi:[NiFe] hydrogenase assembly HybE family chaperone
VSLRVHVGNPADAVESAFFRIQQERMADVPLLNPALCVEAVDFQRWSGHWLGMILTPWCMSLLLVPGSDSGWISVSENKRRFINFPVGDLAFLGSDEPETGEFQSCALFSPMNRFPTQSEAVLTARASLLALLAPPALPVPATSPAVATPSLLAGSATPADQPSLSRRRFMALGRTAGR